jgi:hypothetical protein
MVVRQKSVERDDSDTETTSPIEEAAAVSDGTRPLVESGAEGGVKPSEEVAMINDATVGQEARLVAAEAEGPTADVADVVDQVKDDDSEDSGSDEDAFNDDSDSSKSHDFSHDAKDSVDMKEPTPNGETDSLVALATLLGDENDVGMLITVKHLCLWIVVTQRSIISKQGI